MSKDDANTAVIDGDVIEEALRRCQELDERAAGGTPVGAESDLGPGLVGAHEAITRENMISEEGVLSADSSIFEERVPSEDLIPDTTSPTETSHAAVNARLVDLERVPEQSMASRDVPWHALDHRAGYLLRQVDGQRTYREIILASGIEPVEASELLGTLLDKGCIDQR